MNIFIYTYMYMSIHISGYALMFVYTYIWLYIYLASALCQDDRCLKPAKSEHTWSRHVLEQIAMSRQCSVNTFSEQSIVKTNAVGANVVCQDKHCQDKHCQNKHCQNQRMYPYLDVRTMCIHIAMCMCTYVATCINEAACE